jgi:hypothetical protein
MTAPDPSSDASVVPIRGHGTAGTVDPDAATGRIDAAPPDPTGDPSTGTGTDVDARFEAMVRRLSHLSVDRHFEAFRDVPWDDRDLAVRTDDARWVLGDLDPLGSSPWYQAQPETEQARIGLHRVAQMLHTGWQFENILQIGLLIHAMAQANDSVEFRFLHHELAEESQHSMMFHELVRRSGLATHGMPRWSLVLVRPMLMAAAKWDPLVLCLAALAGEEPIDLVQRRQLRAGQLHPLLETICRIHVTEEARHISFARHFIRKTTPRLGRLRRTALAMAFPIFMAMGAHLMLHPGRRFATDADVPPDVLREAYATRSARQLRADSVDKVRGFAAELGLMGWPARWLWWALFDRPVTRAAS